MFSKVLFASFWVPRITTMWPEKVECVGSLLCFRISESDAVSWKAVNRRPNSSFMLFAVNSGLVLRVVVVIVDTLC